MLKKWLHTVRQHCRSNVKYNDCLAASATTKHHEHRDLAYLESLFIVTLSEVIGTGVNDDSSSND